jgi:prophage regulatory protein
MLNNPIYVSDRDLAARFHASRATIWRWPQTRGFPEPIRFSPGCTRWVLKDVEAWETRMRAADNKTVKFVRSPKKRR